MACWTRFRLCVGSTRTLATLAETRRGSPSSALELGPPVSTSSSSRTTLRVNVMFYFNVWFYSSYRTYFLISFHHLCCFFLFKPTLTTSYQLGSTLLNQWSKTNISFTHFFYSGLDLISLKICSFFPSFISFHRDKTLNEPTSVAINHTFSLLSGQMCAGQAQQKMKYRMKVLCSGLVNNMESCLSVQFYSFTANWCSLCPLHICGALLRHTMWSMSDYGKMCGSARDRGGPRGGPCLL